MEIISDIDNITGAGFDRYLIRRVMPTDTPKMTDTRYLDASNLVGGIIGNEGILYLGSKQVRIDGKNKRIVINDGTTDRVIIGYLG